MSMAVFSLVCAVAFAQGKEAKKEKPAEGAPAMPTLPPEGKRLVEGVLGSWKSSDVALTMGDKTMKGKMTMVCDKAADGWGAVCKAKWDMGKEMPPQTAAFLFAWSIPGGAGHMYEVSNMADVHDHAGTWTDDKTISLAHEGKNLEGKPEKDVVSFTWTSPKQVTVKGEGLQDGKTTWTMTGTMSK